MNLVLRPEVTQQDFPALPRPFRIEAVRVLATLRDHPEALEIVVLGKSHVSLDLSRFGACSVRFGGVISGYRIVFVPGPDGAEVVAVGNRCRSEVFRAAQDRLQPPKPIRHFRTAKMNHQPRRPQ